MTIRIQHLESGATARATINDRGNTVSKTGDLWPILDALPPGYLAVEYGTLGVTGNAELTLARELWRDDRFEVTWTGSIPGYGPAPDGAIV